jgi:hypothetical protein
MIFIGSVKILGRWKIKVFEGARRAGRFSFGRSGVWVRGWSAQAAGRGGLALPKISDLLKLHPPGQSFCP